MRGSTAARGASVARLTATADAINSPPRMSADPRARRCFTTSPAVLTTRNVATAVVPTRSPWLACAVTICPHSAAVASVHRMREDQVDARSNREAAHRVTAVQASVEANGNERPSLEPARHRDRMRPPTVAATREHPSLRRKRYSPSPPIMGVSRNSRGAATSQGRAVYRSIGSRNIQPDCGSATNGVPVKTYGFHAGMVPSRRLWPR